MISRRGYALPTGMLMIYLLAIASSIDYRLFIGLLVLYILIIVIGALCEFLDPGSFK